MAELENEDEVIETTDDETEVVENNEDDNIETEDETELTVEDYQKEKARREKAEKALVELKKQVKNAPKSTDDVRAILAEEKFYDKNPDAEPYRKEIESFVKKWLSRDDWLMLATKKDAEVEKIRNIYWKSLVWGKGITEWTWIVSMEQFDSMTSQAQDEYMQKMTKQYGKVKFK